MLYLEDYVEIIEHLPQELRDRFTEMREMDLGVQNAMDSIKKKVKVFFSNAKKMKPSEREAEHEAIRKEYNKMLEDADEKVQLANQMHELVDRYLRRLDHELYKFKGELEADNEGITEILEKRSLELDQPSAHSSQKENRYRFTSNRSRDNQSSHLRVEKRRDSNVSLTTVEKRVTADRISEMNSSISSSGSSVPVPRPASANSGPLIPQASSQPSVAATAPSAGTSNSVGAVSYNLGQIGAGGNSIAAAASQAIAATQHMQQGRRTASLKASYEAINTGGVHAAEFNREIAGVAQTAIAAIQESSKKNKKKMTSASSVPNANVLTPSIQQQVHQQQQQVAHLQQQAVSSVGQPGTSVAAAVADVPQTPVVVDSDTTEWTFDPNEPRYCICNQVSYGDMVACDNVSCPFEWFHYPCVNITASPKGKWYCPQCASSMKQRGGRKN